MTHHKNCDCTMCEFAASEAREANRAALERAVEEATIEMDSWTQPINVQGNSMMHVSKTKD